MPYMAGVLCQNFDPGQNPERLSAVQRLNRVKDGILDVTTSPIWVLEIEVVEYLLLPVRQQDTTRLDRVSMSSRQPSKW